MITRWASRQGSYKSKLKTWNWNWHNLRRNVVGGWMQDRIALSRKAQSMSDMFPLDKYPTYLLSLALKSVFIQSDNVTLYSDTFIVFKEPVGVRASCFKDAYRLGWTWECNAVVTAPMLPPYHHFFWWFVFRIQPHRYHTFATSRPTAECYMFQSAIRFSEGLESVHWTPKLLVCTHTNTHTHARSHTRLYCSVGAMSVCAPKAGSTTWPWIFSQWLEELKPLK